MSGHDRRAARESNDKNSATLTEKDVIAGAALLAIVPNAEWHAVHRGCDARLDEPDRWISVESMRSIDGSLQLLAHFAEENWFTTKPTSPG